MRRLMATSIVLAVVFLSGLFANPSAQAMTAPIPAGLAPAIQQANPVDEVQYVCRRVRRCGPNGCFWRRVCGGYGGGYRRLLRRQPLCAGLDCTRRSLQAVSWLLKLLQRPIGEGPRRRT